jgi:serine/threonine-protein kinase
VPVSPPRPRRAFHPLAWAAGIAVVAVAVVAGVLPGKAAWLDAGAPPRTVDQQTDTESSPALPLPGGFGGGAGAGTAGVPGPATQAPNGDLGLAVPISSPACDGTFVVFLGAATDPAGYVSAINHLLNSQPDTHYTLTQGGCSSMRQQLPDGSLIYAVYVGPFPDQAAACSARGEIGGDAYIKRMDDVTPPDQPWPC